MGTQKYLGLTLDGDLLKIAHVQNKKRKWVLTQLDRVSIKEEKDVRRKKNKSREKVKEYSDDFHFGIDEHYDEMDHEDHHNDLDLLMDVGEDGKNTFNSNVVTLKNALEGINPKKVNIGLTIRSGNTNYHVLKDKNYSLLNKKELRKYVEDHLKKVYGVVPDSDHYRYILRDDGSLLVISFQGKQYLFDLLDRVSHLYSGNLKILQMLPDEGLLSVLIKQNYTLDPDEVTCVVYMGFNRSRIFFMLGDKIQFAVSPIDEGRGSPDVLDVIYSKILFQIDTGELSRLDRILIVNNDLHNVSVKYFQKQFPDLMVDDFHFNGNKLEIPSKLEDVSGFFTSAIGAALSAAESKNPDHNSYSMLPYFVRERQNTLKLRWHGIMLLILLLVTPVIWNLMYQHKHFKINALNEDLYSANLRIKDLEPVAKQSEQIQNLYKIEQNKMDLLNNLGDGAYYWSNTFKTLNDGLNKIGQVWIGQIKDSKDGFLLQGYTISRSRIPEVTNLFHKAELQGVTVDEMRGTKVYKFSIKVFYDFEDDLDTKFAKSEVQQTTTNNQPITGVQTSDIRN